MPRRRPAGRMIRTMGRTAVVAGTATAVSGRVARRQQASAPAPQEPSPTPTTAPPGTPPAATAPPVDLDARIEALEKLAALKDSGILTEEEFAAEKAKILAS